MRSQLPVLGVWIIMGSQPIVAQTDPSHAPPNTQNAKQIEGRIARVDRDEFLLTVKGGTTETYQLSPSAQLLRARRGSVTDLAVGRRVGCVAIQNPGGKLTATECRIYPDDLPGMLEGHNAMAAPITSMTTGHVTQISGDTKSSQHEPGTVSLQIGYSGGAQEIVVSPLTDIRLITPADRTAVRPGAHIRAISQQAVDGTGVVQTLSVLSEDRSW
jgi:hypothetical protein